MVYPAIQDQEGRGIPPQFDAKSTPVSFLPSQAWIDKIPGVMESPSVAFVTCRGLLSEDQALGVISGENMSPKMTKRNLRPKQATSSMSSISGTEQIAFVSGFKPVLELSYLEDS